MPDLLANSAESFYRDEPAMNKVTIEQAKQMAAKMKRESLEDRFYNAWLDHAPKEFPAPERQFKFHPERRFRYDFAWPQIKLCVDIQGGGFSGGRHSRGIGQEGDHDKANEAQRLGYDVLQFGTKAMDDPAKVIEYVVDFILYRELT